MFENNIFKRGHFKYIKIKTTIATATCEPIEWTTIGGTVGTSSNITIKTIVTFTITDKVRNLRILNTVIGTITITFTIITITNDIIRATTITISVIDETTSDTGAGVSEFRIRGIRTREGATLIQIIQVNHIPLITVEWAE